MISEGLRREVRSTWAEYGRAICKAFNFPPESPIVADGVERMLQAGDEARARKFLVYVRSQIEELGTATFMDEPMPE